MVTPLSTIAERLSVASRIALATRIVGLGTHPRCFQPAPTCRATVCPGCRCRCLSRGCACCPPISCSSLTF
jgi:hypothetical protein